jgi:hypothetical protein
LSFWLVHVTEDRARVQSLNDLAEQLPTSNSSSMQAIPR